MVGDHCVLLDVDQEVTNGSNQSVKVIFFQIQQMSVQNYDRPVVFVASVDVNKAVLQDFQKFRVAHPNGPVVTKLNVFCNDFERFLDYEVSRVEHLQMVGVSPIWGKTDFVGLDFCF